MVSRVAAPVVALLALAVLAPVVRAQETPRHGGELVFVVPAESPSFDAHCEESFALLHPAGPHYNTLLRVDSDGPSQDRRRSGPVVVERPGRAHVDLHPPAGREVPRRQRAGRAGRQGLVDQWRQIGLTVKVETLELATLYNEIRGGNFDVAADFHCSYIVEPDLALFKFQSMNISHVNYGRYTDREARRRHIREFEKRLLDEEVRYIFTFQWDRIVPHNARVRDWTITPSHFLNNQLDTVWLAE